MSKNKILGFGFLGAVLVMLAIGVFALSFQAHAAAPSATTTTTTTTVHSYIIKTTAGVVFKRTTLTVSLKNIFEFTNTTAVSQKVTYKGRTVVTVAAHSSTPYKFAAAGTYVFSLVSNPKATETVTVK